MFSKLKSFGSAVVNKAKECGKSVLAAFGIGSAASVVTSQDAAAQTTPVDYGAVLNTNLDTIDGIWGVVAGIMIAVALVTVGTRFFRKTK